MTDEDLDILIAACEGLTYGNGAPLVGYPFGSLPEMAQVVTAALRQRAESAETVGRGMLAALMKVDGPLLGKTYVEPVQWAETVVEELATVRAERDALAVDVDGLRGLMSAQVKANVQLAAEGVRLRELLRDSKYVIELTGMGLGLSVDGRTISTTVLLAQIDAALKGK